MPLIHVQISTQLSPEQKTALMQELSRSVADGLGKPESYMMVVLHSEASLLMGGRPDPAALAEVRSVGTISPDQARQVAEAVSTTLSTAAGVDAARVYCVFQGVPGSHWAQGANTFG